MYQPTRTRGVTQGTPIDFVPDLGTRLYFQPCENIGLVCSLLFRRWPLSKPRFLYNLPRKLSGKCRIPARRRVYAVLIQSMIR